MISKKIKDNWIILFFIFIVLVSALVIANYTKPIIYDQVVAKYKLDYYPRLSNGLFSHLLIGFYNTIIQPSDALQNIHIKIFAMLLFMTSAFLLARSILKKSWLVAVFLILILLSRFPFLWFSTELIVAAMTFLAIWVTHKRFHPVVISIVLALMAFSKPELILTASVILVYNAFLLRKSRKAMGILLITFIVFSILIVTPGIVKYGNSYFASENRSFITFGWHYAALFGKHQVSEQAEQPWAQYTRYLAANFKGAKTMMDVWLKYPLKYFDFLLLSIGHGLIKVTELFHFLWILLPAAPLFYFREKIKLILAEKTILLSFIGCIPFVVLSFPHIRYFARYYPLVVILILMFLKRLLDTQWKEKPLYKYAVYVSFAVILVTAIINLYLFANNLAAIDTVKEFWFPD